MAYYAIWQTNVPHYATQSQTRSQSNKVEIQIHNPERNRASQTHYTITLPMAKPLTLKKQLISSHSADKN